MNEDTRKALFSHETTEWFTPKDIFDKYDLKFHFKLDPCTSPSNPLGCPLFFTKEHDGLKQEWPEGNVWINPPYGRDIGLWVKKASEHAKDGKGNVVMLLPSRTETGWYQSYIWNSKTETWYDGVKVLFLSPRVRFLDANGKRQDSPTFGSIIAIFSLPTVAPGATPSTCGAGYPTEAAP